jgi:hypothetical protein
MLTLTYVAGEGALRDQLFGHFRRSAAVAGAAKLGFEEVRRRQKKRRRILSAAASPRTLDGSRLRSDASPNWDLGGIIFFLWARN